MSTTIMAHPRTEGWNFDFVERDGYGELVFKVQECTHVFFVTDDQLLELFDFLGASPRVIKSAGALYVERLINAAIALAKVSTEVRDRLSFELRAQDDDERPVDLVPALCDQVAVIFLDGPIACSQPRGHAGSHVPTFDRAFTG